MPAPKKILAIHDLSCRGNASLGLAIPILTAAGHEVISLPSVILSSTTDIEKNPAAISTTEWMGETISRWKDENFKFDAIYTGWLGDPHQPSILADACADLRHDNTQVFIDPVLGDCGMLYSCQDKIATEMWRLVSQADCITPNPTEAALLLGEKPKKCGVRSDGTIEECAARALTLGLQNKYPLATIIIKSVVSKNRIGVCVGRRSVGPHPKSKTSIKTIFSSRAKVPPMSGTGDLFASLLIAFYLKHEYDEKTDDRTKMVAIRSAVNTMSKMMRNARYGETVHLPYRDLLSLAQE